MLELPLNGLWTLPDAGSGPGPGQAREVHGALVEQGGQWLLTLHDFHAVDAPLTEGRWPQIYGIAENGDRLTLADCFVVRGTSSGGVRRANDAEIYVGMIAYGVHVGRGERRIAGFDVVFQGLNKWYGHAGLSQRMGARTVRFDYKASGDIRCPAGDLSVTFSNRARMKPVSRWSEGIDFGLDIVVGVRRQRLMALEEIPDLLHPLHCLLSVCCRTNVAVAKLAAQVKERRLGPWDLCTGLVYYRPALPGRPVPSEPRMFDREFLGDLPAVVSAWHERFPRLENGIHACLAHLGDGSGDLYARVADHVTFVESYLRGDPAMQYMPSEDYQAFLIELSGFLGERIRDDELRKVLYGRAHISNTYSLRTMVNRFVDRHRPLLNRFLSNRKIKKCVYYAVIIRNGIAHARLAPELRDRLDRVMAADLFMGLLTPLCLFECMGLAHDMDIVCGHPYFKDIHDKLQSLDI